MGEYEWDDPVLTVNGQPIRVLQEVDFGGDESESIATGDAASIELPLQIAGETMDRAVKAMEIVCLTFALERLVEAFYRWVSRYRFRQRVEKRHSRTRRRQHPTRLQRRRQRQTKNKLKR